MYDPFSSFQFPELESMGFCARGSAARLSDEGVFDMDGRNPQRPAGALGTQATDRALGERGALIRWLSALLRTS